MNVSSIKLKNFMGVKSAQLTFPKGKVLQVTGSAEDGRSNGSGKSSVFVDGLVWAFFGQPIRNISVDDVIRWGAKAASSEILFSVGEGTEYTLERKRSRGSEKVTLTTPSESYSQKKRVTEAVGTYTGLTKQELQDFFIVTAYTPMFTTLPATQRLQRFEGLLKLDYLPEFKKYISGRKREYDNETARGESLAAKAEWQVKDGKRRVIELNEAIREKGKADYTPALDKAEAAVVEGEKALEAVLSVSTQFNDDRGTLQEKKARFRGLIEAKTPEIQRMQRLTGGKCPLCGNDTDPVHTAQELKRIEGEVEEWENATLEVSEKITAINRKMHDYRTKESSARDKMTQAGKALGRIKVEMSKHDAVIAELEIQKKNALADIEKGKADAEKLQSKLKNRGAISDRMQWWLSTGLVRVRMKMIEAAIEQVTCRVNYYLEAFFNGRLEAVFKVEKEKKQGGAKDELHLEIFNRDTATEYGGQSAGERRSIDLAVQLALADVACPIQFPIEVYDEVLDVLDPAGKAIIIDVLADRAKALDKTIFVITHDPDFTLSEVVEVSGNEVKV